MRDGVGASRVRLPAVDWATLLAFLCERFPAISKLEWTERIGQGHGFTPMGNVLY